MSKSLLIAALVLLASAGSIIIQFSSQGTSEARAAELSAPKSDYMMCERDGAIGRPAASLACIEKHLPDENTICSGTGGFEICETSSFSLCKKAGDLANIPVNDVAAKGTFVDANACMAKCKSEEAIWGRSGGKCLGDITPR